MAKSIYILLITVLVAIVDVESARRAKSAKKDLTPEECNAKLKTCDRTIKTFLMQTSPIYLPNNETKMKSFCKDFLAAGKLAKAYSGCRTGLTRQVIQIFSTTIKKPATYICKKNKELSVNYYSCVTNEWAQQLSNLSRQLQRNMYILDKETHSENVVPMFCCSFTHGLESIYKLPQLSCKAGHDIRKFVFDRINSIVADILDLICGGHKDVATCNQKEPEMMKLITSPLKKDFAKKTDQFLPHVIDGIDKITT